MGAEASGTTCQAEGLQGMPAVTAGYAHFSRDLSLEAKMTRKWNQSGLLLQTQEGWGTGRMDPIALGRVSCLLIAQQQTYCLPCLSFPPTLCPASFALPCGLLSPLIALPVPTPSLSPQLSVSPRAIGLYSAHHCLWSQSCLSFPLPVSALSLGAPSSLPALH